MINILHRTEVKIVQQSS